MDKNEMITLLNQVKRGEIDVHDASCLLETTSDLGYANIDWDRKKRTGYSEVVYGSGKTDDQILGIVQKMLAHGEENILLTRIDKERYESLQNCLADSMYHEKAHMMVVKPRSFLRSDQTIAVITAGTSDIAVAEEAAVTCEVFGNPVDRIYDVGVAGLHRLLEKRPRIDKAHVIICVAGMEGALASVVGGLVRVPVIAVPTSVGYGSNFGGLSALLCMLNSCASGVSVVNIDNGFGAGYLASMIIIMDSPSKGSVFLWPDL